MIAAQRRRRELQDLIERTPADGLVGGTGTVGGPARGRDVLRLHGPRRHPGPAEPPQEGPAVRGRRAPAAAGRVLHRGRRRPARRHRRHRRVRARLPRLQPVRPAVRARAARRHHQRPLLRRQRRHPRLLRRRDRHRGQQHRHGRPRHGRGRRARRVPAGGDRADGRAGAQRRRRRRGARRGRRRRRGPPLPLLLRRARRRRGRRPTPRRPARVIPENRLTVYDVRAAVDAIADVGSVLELRAAFGLGHGHRAGPRRGPADGHRRQQPGAPGRRHRRRRRRQGGPLPAALRRLRPAGAVPLRHARGSWSDPRPSRPRWCAT